MIRSRPEHATGKIVDCDAYCLYAAGLISMWNSVPYLVRKFHSVDRRGVLTWLFFYSQPYVYNFTVP